MQIDISKIIQDKLAAMESDGSVKQLIEDNVENAVREAIKSALGGYKMRQELEKVLADMLPDIVKDIGLDGYSAFVAETVKKLAITGIQENARTVINERVEEILLKKRDKVELSEILKMWRSDMNDNDEEEKRDGNEDHEGFTCRVDKRRTYSASRYFEYYDLFFDEEGDKEGNDPDDYAVVVKIQCWTGSGSGYDPTTQGSYFKGEIQEIYINGNRVSKQFVNRTPSRFEALLMNCYLNNTPIIMDLDKYDADDHYYETAEDY